MGNPVIGLKGRPAGTRQVTRIRPAPAAIEQLGNQQAAAADLAKAAKLDLKLVAAVRAPQTASLVDSTALGARSAAYFT